MQTGSDSRSSTPGTSVDGRIMFSSHLPPLSAQHTLITSYPTVSSPAMTVVPTVFSGTKYLASTPPEAHRFSLETYRVTSEPAEQSRYVIDSDRLSLDPYDSERIGLDPYRQLPGDTQRSVSDMQRIRVEEQSRDSYHPIDLQRVSESNSQQLINAQRLVSQLQRIHSDGGRVAAVSADHLRHEVGNCVGSPGESSIGYRNTINETIQHLSEPPHSMLRTHADPQRLVQESFREYFAASPRHSLDTDAVSSMPDIRVSPESLRFSEVIRSDPQRYTNSLNMQRIILPESIRLNSDASSNLIAKNVRITTIPQNHLSENIRVQSMPPHSMMPENLRIGSNVPQSLILDSMRTNSATPHNAHILHENLRVGAETPHSLISENVRHNVETSHNMLPENLRMRAGSHSVLTEIVRPQSSHILISENRRMIIENSHNVLPENLSSETAASHGLIPENLGVSGEVSLSMMPENLRVVVSAPHNSMMHENLRAGAGTPQAIVAENQRIGTTSTHTVISETLRMGSETPHSMIPENLRIGTKAPHTIIPENLRVSAGTPHAMMPENLRVGAETPHAMMPENVRIDNNTPHTMMSENLRVTPDASRMVPENLCLTEPSHQVMPENLHISPTVNGGTGITGAGDIPNGRILTHSQSTDSPMPPLRSHYDPPPHRIISEGSHSVRVQSPHYIDNIYQSDIHNTVVANASHSSTSSVIPMSDPSPVSVPQYYSSSYSSHNNHYAAYMNDGCDERDMSDNMSLEEKINRGYHDIKPFDQNYPVAVPLMHMSQETQPPPPVVPKPPKPKKPKEPKPPRLPIIHKCNECLRVFKNSTQLKNHMWRHTGEKPFACDECGSKFTQQGNLRAHRRIHTGERPYQCSDCEACFTQLSTLKTHQKIHSDERPYQCNACDAAFRQVANLKTHQVTHTGERPHKCDLCEKAFTQKSNLKAHKNRVHTADLVVVPAKRGRKKNPLAIKPFSCLECGAKFTMVSNLKIHAKLHSGNKPHECDYCGAGFSQRSNLKTHVQRMHARGPGSGRRRIRCDECPAMFRLKRCLKTHKKRRHPIKSLKIKILRESKYLMNCAHSEDDETVADGDQDDEEEDCDDAFEDEEEESDEGDSMVSELARKSNSCLSTNDIEDVCEETVYNDKGHKGENRCKEKIKRETVVYMQEPKVEPFETKSSPETSTSRTRKLEEKNSIGEVGAISSDYVPSRVSSCKENQNLNDKEAQGRLEESHTWEGKLDIKEEQLQSYQETVGESNNLPLLASTTSMS